MLILELALRFVRGEPTRAALTATAVAAILGLQILARSVAAGSAGRSPGAVFSVALLAVVALSVAALLALSTARRASRIGALRAMGMSGGRARLVLLCEAALLALVGSSAGILLGLLSVALLRGVAPLVVSWGFVALSWLVCVLAGVLAAAVASRRSTVCEPFEVMRNG